MLYSKGTPLVESIADMLDQLGYAYRDYYQTGGIPRHHGIPTWAFQLSGISVLLVIIAMSFEWCIVRRKILVNRSKSGMTPAGAVRSKTHLIF
uniref:Uncharacterized protein n=1 Tax=Panagrolaimus superbus TaxID=310955 RepID=A0A914YFV2_9BILA